MHRAFLVILLSTLVQYTFAGQVMSRCKISGRLLVGLCQNPGLLCCDATVKDVKRNIKAGSVMGIFACVVRRGLVCATRNELQDLITMALNKDEELRQTPILTTTIIETSLACGDNRFETFVLSDVNESKLQGLLDRYTEEYSNERLDLEDPYAPSDTSDEEFYESR